jgi:hypothetical protein
VHNENVKRVCLACNAEITREEYEHAHGLHEKCFLETFSLKTWEDFRGIEKRHAGSAQPVMPHSPASKLPSQTKHLSSQHSFFHGNFKKYSARLGETSYILKVRDDHIAPELPDVEFLSNSIAQLFGIPVAWFALIDFYGTRTFVTRNFIAEMRVPATLTHIYHFFEANQPYSCKEIISLISQETEGFKDIETFIHMCLFDALIGNHDRHGRNIGIITTSKGKKLSPIYDNPSALGLETGPILKATFDPRCKVETSTSQNPSMNDYVNEFASLGYFDSINRFAKRVNHKKIEQLIKESTCTALMKEALLKLIKTRIKEMRDAILQH